MDKYFLILISISVFVVICPFVLASAAGVTPPITQFMYTGEDYKGSFYCLTDSEKDLKVFQQPFGTNKIFFEGEKTELIVHSTGAVKIDFTVKINGSLKPGIYDDVIVCESYFTPEEKSALGEGTAVAIAAAGHVFRLRIPNDGRFIEPNLEILPIKISPGTRAYFNLGILNIGTETLDNIKARLTVYDPSELKVAEPILTAARTIKTSESTTLKASMDTKGMGAGRYPIKVEVDYGASEPYKLDSTLRIGDILINIINVSSELNSSISKIFVDVESNWNEQIDNVYAEIKVKNGSGPMDNLKTSSVNIKPWGRERLVAFWERGALSPGNYDMDIYVYYFDKQANKQAKVTLTEQETESASPFNYNLLLIVGGALVLLFVINITWFMINMKKNKNTEKPKVNQTPIKKPKK